MEESSQKHEYTGKIINGINSTDSISALPIKLVRIIKTAVVAEISMPHASLQWTSLRMIP